MHCEDDRLSETFLIANFRMVPLKLLMGVLVKWVGLKLLKENFVVQEAIAMEMGVDRRGGILDWDEGENGDKVIYVEKLNYFLLLKKIMFRRKWKENIGRRMNNFDVKHSDFFWGN